MTKSPALPLVAAFVAAMMYSPQSEMVAAGGGGGGEIPDFTRGDSIPEGASHDWNLGPIGARGWMYSNRLETSEARQIQVTEVASGSPAEGVLEVGDVILGVAGQTFQFDPRTELGKAIGVAEGSHGNLVLIRWRDGETSDVTVSLPVLGRYSPTAPFDCPKSKRIFEQGCEALAEAMKAEPDKGNPIIRSYNALALLASGREEYLPLVRDQVAWASKYTDPERRSYHSWYYGPVTMLVAEYTLATGDDSFRPDLERLASEIVRGQSPVGSWGHRFVQDDGRLAGYGMMNAPGVPLATALVLARKAGVESKALDEGIERSLLLVRFYEGKGSVPYGDHHPWIQTHDDNGKNGAAAVLFNLAGEAGPTEYFSRMSVASHGAERDTGHTGNYFNMLWALPGVALSGPHASGAWMEEFGWYYDLARRFDGTFQHQGPPAAKPDKYHGWDTSGPNLLAYGQALRNIYLCGKQASLAPQIEPEASKKLIEDGHGWGPREKHRAYEDRSDADLLAGLQSWSPVVRERSAMTLAKRDADAVPVKVLVERLDSEDLYTRLGACQALIALGKAASPAVSALRRTLQAEDLWLRIKAAEALAAIGEPAKEAIPDLLAMLANGNRETDPRGMEQRYLCFALFQSRGGMLKGSLEGVDREALYRAVKAGLENEDGRARGALGSVYRNLSYEEIEPLLPAIHRAVVEPAPSGIMFADGIRLSGLEVLAKHRIAEGVPLCVELIEPDRWGKGGRIVKCLTALQLYGGAARDQLPELQVMLADLLTHREAKKLQKEVDLLRETMKIIEADSDPPKLRSLASIQ